MDVLRSIFVLCRGKERSVKCLSTYFSTNRKGKSNPGPKVLRGPPISRVASKEWTSVGVAAFWVHEAMLRGNGKGQNIGKR